MKILDTNINTHTAEANDSDKYKQAAVEQWTADPCGTVEDAGEPGSKAYFERLLRERREDGPWIAEALEYAEARELRVLDVGCGQGIDLANYAMAGADVTGIDLTPHHIELARSHFKALGLKATMVVGDAESLPFADESFDRAFSLGVLHHTPDMPRALCEIYRVLKLGGEARVIVYNRNSFHFWINQFLLHGLLQRQLFHEGSIEGVLSRGVERTSIGARPLVRVYSQRQVRRMMREAGFIDVKTNVRHFHAGDTFVTEALARRTRVLRNPRVLSTIGRIGGWYIVAHGVRWPA